MTEMAQVQGRTVPHNLDAERSVLGALLLHGSEEVIGEVSQALQADDFFLAPHRLIFRAILATFDRVAHSDPITVAEELERLGSLAEVGGRDRLLDLAGGVLSPAGVLYHAEIVREKSMQRRLLETCLDIARCAYENATGTADLIDEAERRIFEIARTGGEAQTKKIGDVMMGVLERIDALRGRNQRVTGIATRYEDLDDYTSGLQPGELVVVAARPSMGKTSLALNLAERVASQGLGTAFFSLEMSSQQVIQNMLCARSQIDSMALRRGRVTEDQYRRVHEEAARLYDAPLFIDDSPGLTITSLRAKCRRLKSKHDIKLVVVDYLQLMTAGGRVESRQQEIAVISRAMKGLARELSIPVVALAQLNREVEVRDNHRPRMSDLRESGAIEQDADVVMLLHRDEYYQRTEENAGLAQIIIAKQRNGPTGEVTLRFFREFMRFESFHRKAEPIA
jgi:replicative DNA helicase